MLTGYGFSGAHVLLALDKRKLPPSALREVGIRPIGKLPVVNQYVQVIGRDTELLLTLRLVVEVRTNAKVLIERTT
jgi:hypothetical protein